ncbi:MAG: hypothetical protein PVI75_09045 [Gammaproteobacteria bacterium]|jgi:hypothetical protein
MKTAKYYENRIKSIKKQLLAIGDMHPGSLSKQFNICGNPKCKCKDPDNPKKHGPYYQLSFIIKGKSTSRFIKPEFVPEIKRQLANYKKFKTLTENWKLLATELAKLRIDLAKKNKKVAKK